MTRFLSLTDAFITALQDGPPARYLIGRACSLADTVVHKQHANASGAAPFYISRLSPVTSIYSICYEGAEKEMG